MLTLLQHRAEKNVHTQLREARFGRGWWWWLMVPGGNANCIGLTEFFIGLLPPGWPGVRQSRGLQRLCLAHSFTHFITHSRLALIPHILSSQRYSNLWGVWRWEEWRLTWSGWVVAWLAGWLALLCFGWLEFGLLYSYVPLAESLTTFPFTREKQKKKDIYYAQSNERPAAMEPLVPVIRPMTGGSRVGERWE